jgi:hypothetical protein
MGAGAGVWLETAGAQNGSRLFAWITRGTSEGMLHCGYCRMHRGVKLMASKTQPEFKAKPPSSNRDLAYRSSQDVSGPLTVILAVIAFVLLASFVYSLDWHYTSDLPVVTESQPSTAPANPPLTPPENS